MIETIKRPTNAQHWRAGQVLSLVFLKKMKKLLIRIFLFTVFFPPIYLLNDHIFHILFFQKEKATKGIMH